MTTGSPRLHLCRSLSVLLLLSACQGAPPANLQLVPVQAATPSSVERRILLTVHFGFDQYVIRSDSFETLNNLAAALNDPRLRGVSYEINGHTDLKGNFAHNVALSALRAKSVSDYLRDHGVQTPPIRAQGFGPLQLLYPKEPYNSGNRRVEVVAIGP